MTTAITPTIGRKVWFWASVPDEFNIEDHDQALDATVIFVHSSGLLKGRVNLLVTDHWGEQHYQDAIELRDFREGDRHFAEQLGAPTATWMPYQMSQAKKEEMNKAWAEAKRDVGA